MKAAEIYSAESGHFRSCLFDAEAECEAEKQSHLHHWYRTCWTNTRSRSTPNICKWSETSKWMMKRFSHLTATQQCVHYFKFRLAIPRQALLLAMLLVRPTPISLQPPVLSTPMHLHLSEHKFPNNISDLSRKSQQR